MTWRNWSGTVTAEPREVVAPVDAGAAAGVLAGAAASGRRVRPLGSGHSFSPIGQPTDIAVSLAALTGVRSHNLANGHVWVGAGTRLRDLNRELDALGLALPNLGDIDHQTIAGAIATGTHGTGLGLLGIAAAVVGVELATPAGQVLRCTPGDGTFEAARINLGALGIVTAVELQAVPAFRLRAVEGPLPLAEVLADPRAFAASADHAEFFWFPHTHTVSTRRNHRDGADGEPLPAWRTVLEGEVLNNGVFALVNRVGADAPRLVPGLNRLSAAAMGSRTYADRSHRVFCSPRRVRFVESEYAVPIEAVAPVLHELRAWYGRTRAPVQFPVEVRFVAADDVWLSGAYGRETAYVAVHQYVGAAVGDSFDAFERIVAGHDGRPHWGKQQHARGRAVARGAPAVGRLPGGPRPAGPETRAGQPPPGAHPGSLTDLVHRALSGTGEVVHRRPELGGPNRAGCLNTGHGPTTRNR